MSASTGGAIKALLEAAGLGVPVYRDSAPPSAGLPYIVVHECITLAPELAFNPRSDAAGHVIEEVQVSVWQRRRDPTTSAISESYTLPDAVCAALHGARLTTLPTYGGHTRMTGRTRLFEDDGSVIHDPITIEVRRTLARRP